MKSYEKGGNQDARNNAIMAELNDLGNKRTEPVQQKRPDTSVDQKTSIKMRKPVKSIDPVTAIRNAQNRAK